jgi:tetratricopeptide (TPR) repeat protein
MVLETLLVKGLGWVVGAAAGGIVEGRADDGFHRARQSLRERLSVLRQSESTDLVHGVRHAQFRALEQLIRDYQAVSAFSELSAPAPFVERALAYARESLRLIADSSFGDASTVTRIVSSAVAGVDESSSTADGVREVEDAVLGELRVALHGVSLPPAFEEHVRNGGGGRRRFVELFAVYVADEIKGNAAFRDILNVHLHLQTLGAARDASQLAEQILQQFGPALQRIEDAVGGVSATADEIRATQVTQGAAIDEILRIVSAEKGVPVAPLRQILARLGELDVPHERIVERLDASASEYLSLREKWLQVAESTPDVAEVKAEALVLIDAGDFNGARRLFGDAREKVRAARHGRAREEASLLAGEADVDRLELRYRDAAERYAEAASLVSAFDPTARFNYLWKQARTNSLLGEEFGDNSALLDAIEGWRQLLALNPRESQPLQWAATQTSLGNALARLGQREGGIARLEEAVAAYQAALKERTRERAPLDWAATQNNLGAALMRLGTRESGTARLEEAVAAYQAALQEYTREQAPLEWAMTQNNIGNALAALGGRESGTARLEEAVAAYRAALEEYPQERAPLAWATTQNNLGTVLSSLGERESGIARLEEAVAAYQAALKERRRERVPLKWAMTQNNLGSALGKLGERESGTVRLEQAVEAFRAALEERTRERVPLDWAATQNNLGNALHVLGKRENRTARLEEAVAAHRAALEERTRGRVPLDWATTQNNLGNALQSLGELDGGTAQLRAAVVAYRAALEERTRERVPLDWAKTQANLGNTLSLLGERERETIWLEEGVAAYRIALDTFVEAGADYFVSITQQDLDRTLRLLDERLGR